MHGTPTQCTPSVLTSLRCALSCSIPWECTCSLLHERMHAPHTVHLLRGIQCVKCLGSALLFIVHHVVLDVHSGVVSALEVHSPARVYTSGVHSLLGSMCTEPLVCILSCTVQQACSFHTQYTESALWCVQCIGSECILMFTVHIEGTLAFTVRVSALPVHYSRESVLTCTP